MTNITAGFLLAAYVLYIVANGDLGRIMRVVFPQSPPSSSLEKVRSAATQKIGE